MLGVEPRTDRSLLAAPSRNAAYRALTDLGKANAKRASRVVRATVRPNPAFNTDVPWAALRAGPRAAG